MEDNAYEADSLTDIKSNKLFPLLWEIKSFDDRQLIEELYSSVIRMLKKTIIPALRGYDRTEFEIQVPERFEVYEDDILSILRKAHRVGYEIASCLKGRFNPFQDVVNLLACCVEEMGVDSTEYRKRVDEARKEYTPATSHFFPPSKN